MKMKLSYLSTSTHTHLQESSVFDGAKLMADRYIYKGGVMGVFLGISSYGKRYSSFRTVL